MQFRRRRLRPVPSSSRVLVGCYLFLLVGPACSGEVGTEASGRAQQVTSGAAGGIETAESVNQASRPSTEYSLFLPIIQSTYGRDCGPLVASANDSSAWTRREVKQGGETKEDIAARHEICTDHVREETAYNGTQLETRWVTPGDEQLHYSRRSVPSDQRHKYTAQCGESGSCYHYSYYLNANSQAITRQEAEANGASASAANSDPHTIFKLAESTLQSIAADSTVVNARQLLQSVPVWVNNAKPLQVATVGTTSALAVTSTAAGTSFVGGLAGAAASVVVPVVASVGIIAAIGLVIGTIGEIYQQWMNPDFIPQLQPARELPVVGTTTATRLRVQPYLTDCGADGQPGLHNNAEGSTISRWVLGAFRPENQADLGRFNEHIAAMACATAECDYGLVVANQLPTTLLVDTRVSFDEFFYLASRVAQRYRDTGQPLPPANNGELESLLVGYLGDAQSPVDDPNVNTNEGSRVRITTSEGLGSPMVAEGEMLAPAEWSGGCAPPDDRPVPTCIRAIHERREQYRQYIRSFFPVPDAWSAQSPEAFYCAEIYNNQPRIFFSPPALSSQKNLTLKRYVNGVWDSATYPQYQEQVLNNGWVERDTDLTFVHVGNTPATLAVVDIDETTWNRHPRLQGYPWWDRQLFTAGGPGTEVLLESEALYFASNRKRFQGSPALVSNIVIRVGTTVGIQQLAWRTDPFWTLP
jgi:hypothetical protein